MASFFIDLWESIFTPGPTRSLLVATNTTFACLQVVLFVLLVFSYSVHFAILSFLCGGLWWSVNWFAGELKEAQQRQDAEQAKARREALLASDDSETEVETSKPPPPVRKSRGVAEGASTEVEAVEPSGELKNRLDPIPLGMLSSASTEDEWEKVSESEKDK